jgi:hypothetical protein
MQMRLGYSGEPRQATLTDLAGMHAFAGQFDEALAELEDVESWNLGLRYISTRNRLAPTPQVQFRSRLPLVLEVLDNTHTPDISLK